MHGSGQMRHVDDAERRLAALIANSRKLLVLTGAGCSTASGIGDYRDEQGQWKRAAPVQHGDFMRSEHVRKRYWARSFHGWPFFSEARPNDAHRALVDLNPLGIITQNVDRLHQKAGSEQVIDLHGRLDRVRCMACEAVLQRSQMQERLASLNPWLGRQEFTAAPDGDADLLLSQEQIDHVVLPSCAACGGVLKPDVVFYGDGVPRSRVDEAYRWVDDCDAMLVVGSSLMVFSGLRFCRRAAARGVPMALVNRGVTRSDELFDVRVDAPCEVALPGLHGAGVG